MTDPKDEGGRMKDEGVVSSFILHPSSFILLTSSGNVVPEGPRSSTSTRPLAADG
jgi:hypothetical protein